MSEVLSLGIDIGGTKVSGGVVDEGGQIVVRAHRNTPHRSQRPRAVEDTIVSTIAELTAAGTPGASVVAVGVGAAGFVDARSDTVVFSPHLSWRDEPLAQALAHRIDRRVHVENDANAALWAESRFGAARGLGEVVMITIGTGLGGGILIDGDLYRGRYGMAGEFGHTQVVPHGHRCECGNRGCWEQYASGNALLREARNVIGARPPRAHDFADLVARTPGGLSGPLITQAARAGDPTARELLAQVGHWLGVGLAGVAAALDPARLVIGGGVSAAGDLLLDPARQAFRATLIGRGHRPEADIVTAELGNDAGLVGAADLARATA